MDDFEAELKAGFLEEATQILEEAENCFLSLESNPQDPAIIESIFRLAHNLKGSSRAVGFSEMAEFTHVFESLLLKLKNKELQVQAATVSLLLKCNDHLREWVTNLKSDFAATMDSVELVGELKAQIEGVAAAPSAEEALPAAETPVAELNSEVPTVEAQDAPVEAVLPNPEAFPEVAAGATCEVALPPAGMDMRFSEEVTPVVESAKPAPSPVVKKEEKAPAKPAASQEDESIRVSLKRLEQLLNNVGELVILQTVLNEQRFQIQNPLINRTISQLAKITKDIQSISMGLRMVPLKQTFQKMQRIVRDTSKALGKEIDFEISGENHELDKTVVDQLGDPLVHLIRNSCDHGVETNDEREQIGKPRTGKVKLSAYHKGGQLVIEVRDDGKGLDPNKLRQKAIEKGIIKPTQVLSDKEAYHLIFAAGFSTKTEVTEVSGRGVGMDVVRTNIEKKLQGEIQLETELGKGTTFKIFLPLTLAIIDGMVVSVGEERYIIPLSHVHETLQPRTQDLHAVTGLGDVLSLRGEELPVLKLGPALGRKSPPRSAEDSIALVVRSGEQPFSVLVDDIIGHQQIVIKQLGAEMKDMRGVTGGAILGDGRAALILDLVELANRNKGQTARGAA